MAPVFTPASIALPILCDDDAHTHFQLFDCEKKYSGLLNMFEQQLVINTVDTDAKRVAVKKFVDDVRKICKENKTDLREEVDVKSSRDHHSSLRYVTIRPDDALDCSDLKHVTAWYMVSETAFATAAAFLQMSSDRPTPDKPVNHYLDLLSTLHEAMREGNAVKAMAILDANPALLKVDVCKGFGYPFGRIFSAVIDGHVELVEYLISAFNLTKEEVCGSTCKRFACQALKNGHLEMVKMLCLHFDLTKEDVCGVDNCGLYAAVRHGHLEAIQWVVKHFKLA